MQYACLDVGDDWTRHGVLDEIRPAAESVVEREHFVAARPPKVMARPWNALDVMRAVVADYPGDSVATRPQSVPVRSATSCAPS